jgi:hypothetical protein
VDEEMQDTLKLEALPLGSQTLLDDIHDEAVVHIDEFHPWDGRGDEPSERLSAYFGVMWPRQRIQLARFESSGSARS